MILSITNSSHSHSHAHPKSQPIAHSHAHNNGGAFRAERQMSRFSYRYSVDEVGRSKCIDLEQDIESSESGGSHDGAEHGHSHGGPSSVKKVHLHFIISVYLSFSQFFAMMKFFYIRQFGNRETARHKTSGIV